MYDENRRTYKIWLCYLIIGLAFLSLLGYFTSAVGRRVETLATSAIDEWYPKRDYACWEHSGEFDELFALQNIGYDLKLFGYSLTILSGIAILCIICVGVRVG